MAEHLTVLIERIHDLLNGESSRPLQPLLPEIEHTLTDGYARTLSLEGERRRIERRIGELLPELKDLRHAEELRSLSVRLKETDDDLARLRALLGALSERARRVRSAASEAPR